MSRQIRLAERCANSDLDSEYTASWLHVEEPIEEMSPASASNSTVFVFFSSPALKSQLIIHIGKCRLASVRF